MRPAKLLVVAAVVVAAAAAAVVVAVSAQRCEPSADSDARSSPCPAQTGSLTADRPGMVLSGLDVRGMLTVTAPGVVVRNSKFTGDGSTPWGIRTSNEGSVRIEDTLITGDYTDAGIAYGNWSAIRVEITGMSNDGAKLGAHTSITDSWIHDFAPSPGAHSDGLQLTEDVGDVVVKNNRIEIGTGEGANSAVFLSPDIGPDHPDAGPVVISGNTLGGGGYTFYSVGGQQGARLKDVVFTGNTFLPGAKYGPIYPSEFDVRIASGNVFAGGAPVPLPR
ncbi:MULTISPECIES: hypothetical protein [unclassified Amycolatopsis]|uniref:hypothetical protein n=1 Tax=unclassified Amycolatopsis TaxID=2618356 RepID=UPI001EE89189|nr:hypothetical protein [Amycolatopsis sp. Poz14]MCG3748914.1 hypothetical protein [Amycolatopsis sp. Poz14]